MHSRMCSVSVHGVMQEVYREYLATKGMLNRSALLLLFLLGHRDNIQDRHVQSMVCQRGGSLVREFTWNVLLLGKVCEHAGVKYFFESVW